MSDKILLKKASDNILKLILCVLSITYALFYSIFINQKTPSSHTLLNIVSIILLLVYVFCAFVWIKSTGRVVSPFFLLLVSCFAFNGGQVLLYLLGIDINNWYIVYDRTHTDLLIKAICFQTASVLSLTLGAIIVAKPTSKLVSPYIKKDDSNNDRIFDLADIIFLILTIINLAFLVSSLIMRSSFKYGVNLDESSSLRYYINYSFCIMLFYEMLRTDNRLKTRVLAFIAAFTVVATFLIGARYKIVPIALGIAIIQLIIKNKNIKLSFWKILIVAVIAILFLSLMRGWTILRQYPLSALNWDLIKKTYSSGLSSGLYDTLAETGNSIQVLTKTISNVDSGNASGDRTILYSLVLGFVPKKIVTMLGWTPEITSLSGWITTSIGALDGQGFSLFAEAYFNYHGFGYIFLFIFGLIYSKLENFTFRTIQSASTWETILGLAVMYLLNYACFLSRADMILMSSYIRFCFYILIIVFISNGGKIIIHKFKNS